ncbi:MAG: hypothetical protein JJ974_09530, partial [Phycisphaerales bacterium]|nr:hypothetical protein [Phycisphaerales bacterium]
MTNASTPTNPILMDPDAPAPGAQPHVQVIHANWHDGQLHLWIEQCPSGDWWTSVATSIPATPADDSQNEAIAHPNTTIPDWIQGRNSSITLRLPIHDLRPIPSAKMAMFGGIETEEIVASGLADVRISTLALDPHQIPPTLESLIDRQDAIEDFHVGPGVQYFVAASRLAEHLIAGHRFVPMVFQDADGRLTGRWQPWLSDDKSAKRVHK